MSNKRKIPTALKAKMSREAAKWREPREEVSRGQKKQTKKMLPPLKNSALH